MCFLRSYISFSLGKYRVFIYFFNHVTIVLLKCDKKFQKVHLLLCFCIKFPVKIRKIREGTLLAAELLLFVMAYCEHEITVTAQLKKKKTTLVYSVMAFFQKYDSEIIAFKVLGGH